MKTYHGRWIQIGINLLLERSALPGAGVKLARRVFGLTQQHVADMIGVTTRTVNRWEGGATTPKTRDLHYLADKLHEYTVRELLKVDACVRELNTSYHLSDPSEEEQLRAGIEASFEDIDRRTATLAKFAVFGLHTPFPIETLAEFFGLPTSILKVLPLSDSPEGKMTLADIGIAIEARVRGVDTAKFVEQYSGVVGLALLYGQQRARGELLVAWDHIYSALVRQFPIALGIAEESPER
jgi:transcriptional regulator with XRE-family HTH domain